MAALYLITMVLFLPFPFLEYFPGSSEKHLPFPDSPVYDRAQHSASLMFPHDKLGEMLSVLISLLGMALLGFADDVLDIPWRLKLFMPMIASIPMLVVYYVSFGSTWVLLPRFLRPLFGGMTAIDLGIMYYAYMMLVTIFCTHSINILAGVNGVEVGQSIIIAASIAINDIAFVLSGTAITTHLFSLYFLLPFIAVSLGLLLHNWYPANVFVGDTYCYFAGMTVATIGIQEHFSKTVLLFFLPQLVNFAMSLPQLFKQVDCPRHRLPRLNTDTGKLEPSWTELKRVTY